MRKIEHQKQFKLAKSLAKVNLSKMIKDTSKDFQIALYDLSKATHDMKPRELTANIPSELEIIDKVPTL